MSDEKETSKQKTLLERVFALFARDGLSSQTMEGIAESIGISKRTLYKYFPGKELLINRVVQYKLESVESQILELLASGKPYHERLIGFFVIVEQALKPMANKLMIDIMRNTPWLWQKVDEFRHNRILIHLEALLNEGADLGYLRSDLNLRLISPLYIAVIEQIGRPEFFRKVTLSPTEVVSTLIRIVLGGILNDTGRELFKDAEKELANNA